MTASFTDVLTGDTGALLAVAFGVGIVIGLTGMGGGALMTPALIFLNIPPAVAVANDLVAAAVNKSVGATVHWRNGSPNFRLAGWLIAGSVPTAFAGAFLVDGIGDAGSQEAFLRAAIGAALLLASATYALRICLSFRQLMQNKVIDEHIAIRPLPTMLLGAVGGLLVGLTSVGSGSVIMVILLVMYPSLAPVKLVGTDLLQAIPLVTSAAVGHLIVNGVDFSVLIPLIVGGSPGTYLGARLASRVPQSIVRRGVTIVLFLTGLSLIKVPPYVVGVVGVSLVLLGPVVWMGVRRLLLASVEGRTAPEGL